MHIDYHNSRRSVSGGLFTKVCAEWRETVRGSGLISPAPERWFMGGITDTQKGSYMKGGPERSDLLMVSGGTISLRQFLKWGDMCLDFIFLSSSTAKVPYWLNPTIIQWRVSWCSPRGYISWPRKQDAKGGRVSLEYIWHGLCPRCSLRKRQKQIMKGHNTPPDLSAFSKDSLGMQICIFSFPCRVSQPVFF